MSEPRIVFRDVRKSFRMRNRSDSLRDAIPRTLRRMLGGASGGAERFTALDGVSFQARAGEVLGLVGANGAGKSTSLRLAAGVYPPDGGSIEVSGPISALIELQAGFHPDLSGRENIFLAGALLGMKRRDVEAVLEPIAAFADIGEYLESPVRTYSSGMAVRLGFAVAAHVPAEILLVDEVLAVGDLEFRAKCMERMSLRREEGTTVLFVSHNLSAVEQFCDRVIFLHNGKVLADGAPRETLATYRSLMADEAHVASVRESASPQIRRGTREVLLEDVRIGEDGAVRAGEALSVTARYSVRKSVPAPRVGLAVHTAEGVLCGSTSTLFPGAAEAGSEGGIDVEIPGLPLLSGSYEVSVYVTDDSGLLLYDYHQCLYTLRVGGEEREGIVSFNARWRIR